MSTIGFSTGALAHGDFRRGLELQAGRGLKAIELSALRDVELVALTESFPQIDLSEFDYISVHAPSRISTLPEREIIEILERQVPATWPIVVHPDVMRDVVAWRALGERLCLENMDQRKSTGRTVAELAPFFEQLPEARFCLDLAHARQVDSTMSIAFHLIEAFGGLLAQIHVSEVNEQSRHVSLNAASVASYRRVSRHLPSCPWIIESVIQPEDIDREIQKVSSCMNAPICVPRMSLVD